MKSLIFIVIVFTFLNMYINEDVRITKSLVLRVLLCTSALYFVTLVGAIAALLISKI